METLDMESFNIVEKFPDIFSIIEYAISKKEPILVHWYFTNVCLILKVKQGYLDLQVLLLDI